MSEDLKIKKSTIYLVGIIFFFLIFGFVLFRGGGSTGGNAVVAEVEGDYQKIVLGIKNYNYYPQEIKVKANQPVRIYLDNSVSGCFRSFTIRDFGVQEYLRTPSDYVEFIPTKKGEFTFACGMGMGTGTLIVE